MTLFLFIVIAGAVYYFIIYKMDYKKLFHGNEEKKCIIDSIKSGVVAVNNDMLITSINSGAKVIFNINND